MSVRVDCGRRSARLALDRPDPDLDAARAGFLQGRIHPDDVPGLIALFVHFRSVPYMTRAVDVWAAADVYVVALDSIAERIHALVEAGADPALLRPLLDEVDRIDVATMPLADAFSAHLGDAARWVRHTMLRLFVLAGALLVAVGVAASWLVTRHVRRGARVLEESRRRLVEEARVAGALVRAGHELIAVRDGPTQLDRLCQLTAELLGCDLSNTWLHEAADDAFCTRAGFGQTNEEREGMHVLRLAPHTLESLLDRLRTGGVLALGEREHAELGLAPLARHAALRPGRHWQVFGDADGDGLTEVRWLRDDGQFVNDAYLDDPSRHFLAWQLDGDELGDADASLWFGYNGWSSAIQAALPDPPTGLSWRRVIDTSPQGDGFGWVEDEGPVIDGSYSIDRRSLVVLVAR